MSNTKKSMKLHFETRARLGRECSSFLSRNGGQTLKVKVNDLHFQYQLRESQDANLVILAQIHYKLSQRQAKFPRILSQNDLEGQGQWHPFSIPAKSIPGCMFGANLVILAQIYDKLLRRQAEFPRFLSQNGIEGQGQWPPFSIPTESITGCMFGANLVILAQIYDELLHGQAEFPIILSQNDRQGQGQWPPFSIPAESISGCMFGGNLVILDQICGELSCGQSKVYRRMDAGNDNTPSAWKAKG